MQSVRRVVRAIPFPFVGYMLGLVGFVCLGGFVAALAGGHSFAPALGGAVVVAFVAMVLCFRVRSFAIAQPVGDGVELSSDLMVDAAEQGAAERYLARYRPAE
ncbi:hypothetical protein RHDE110596_16465 [Prescottella defluvii]|uniref:hypothetical protein n=1 Tax=Prescottella defluvii TaxID=1323361 RepID=UPI00068C0E78|nr:hypothetical protein [Prescottella defluvii]